MFKRFFSFLFVFTSLDHLGVKDCERHSGVKVEVPLRLKRYPLLATCVVFWKLYRRGAYR